MKRLTHGLTLVVLALSLMTGCREAERLPPGAELADMTRYEGDFRKHYDQHYANTGYGYDQYRPAYHYGFDLAKDLNAADVQMTPWAQAIQTQREARNHVDDPYGYCLPPGTPRITFAGGPFKILRTREVTAFLYETIGGMTFRQVFTDGRSLPQTTDPTWLGYSVGHWDGDVFVAETTGFRDGGWLDTRKARPHSDALKVTERYRRTDFGHMQLTITIDDRKAFLKPWTIQARLTLLPDTDLVESFCDNHDKTMEHRRIEAVTEPPSPR